MKFFNRALLLCFLLLSSAFSLFAKETIKIGAILPLTGNSQQMGTPLREIIQYKFDHLPADRHFDYKLVFTDDQLVPAQALSEAKRLVELENVDALITCFTGPSTVVAPYATQKKIPHLMSNLNEKAFDGVYTFDHMTPLNKSAQLWTQQAEKRYHKVAFLMFNNPAGNAMLKALKACQPNSKLAWTAEERFNPGERDFRMTLLKLQETKPEALFIFAVEPELEIIAHQLRQVGWDIPITSCANFELAAGNPLFEGAWFVGCDFPTPEYQDWFIKTFNKPVPYMVATYNDISELYYYAYETAGALRDDGKKPTAEQVTAVLRTVKDFPGACGAITCDTKGMFRTAPTLLIIKNGLPCRLAN